MSLLLYTVGHSVIRNSKFSATIVHAADDSRHHKDHFPSRSICRRGRSMHMSLLSVIFTIWSLDRLIGFTIDLLFLHAALLIYSLTLLGECLAQVFVSHSRQLIKPCNDVFKTI